MTPKRGATSKEPREEGGLAALWTAASKPAGPSLGQHTHTDHQGKRPISAAAEWSHTQAAKQGRVLRFLGHSPQTGPARPRRRSTPCVVGFGGPRACPLGGSCGELELDDAFLLLSSLVVEGRGAPWHIRRASFVCCAVPLLLGWLACARDRWLAFYLFFFAGLACDSHKKGMQEPAAADPKDRSRPHTCLWRKLDSLDRSMEENFDQ
jgi:hypothetical protein